jgi:hypothetical protein
VPATTFSELVDDARKARGWGVGKLASHIGALPDGRTLDGKQVSLIIQGRRRYFDGMLVEAIIDALDLDPAEAYRLAGVLPPATPLDVIRELLDARERLVIAGDSALAASKRARRQRHRTTPPPDPTRHSGRKAVSAGQPTRHLRVVREGWAA